MVPARPRRRSRNRTANITISFTRTHVLFVAAVAMMGSVGLVAGGFHWGQRSRPAVSPSVRAVGSATKIAVLPSKSEVVAAVVASSAPVTVVAPVSPPMATKTATAVPAPAVVLAPSVVPPPVSEPIVKILGKAPRRGFGVQIGAHEDEAEAVSFVQAHAAALQNYPVYVIAAKVRDGQVWHRIRVGRYRSRSLARAAKAGLPSSIRQAAMVVRYR